MCDYHLEMLSLSQDQQNPPCIQFDDSNWQLHLTSLKPLGLNVLLNLCNASVTERLCRFSDHLCNIALQESHSAVLPVHVPWGLCELARLIGAWAPTPDRPAPGMAFTEIAGKPPSSWSLPFNRHCCPTASQSENRTRGGGLEGASQHGFRPMRWRAGGRRSGWASSQRP